VALLLKVVTPDLQVAGHASLMRAVQHVQVPCKRVQSSQDALRAEGRVVQQATKMMILAARRLKVAKQFENY
jgi:hypothetical protein